MHASAKLSLDQCNTKTPLQPKQTHDSLMNTKIANDTPRHAQHMWQTEDMSRTPQRAPTPYCSVILFDIAFGPQSPRSYRGGILSELTVGSIARPAL